MPRLGAPLFLVVLPLAVAACWNSVAPPTGPTGGASSLDGGATSGGSGVGGAVSSGSGPASGGVNAGTGGDSGPGLGGGGMAEDGGAPGSGAGTSTGGAGFFGDSRCAGSELSLCDGFEGATIDTALWTVAASSNNVVELASDQAARGQQSVHIKNQGGFGYLLNESFFPAPNNDYFGRMFLRVKRFSTVEWAHWTVGEGAGTGDGSKIRVGGQYRTDLGKNRWGVGSDGGKTGDWTSHDQDPDGKPTEPPTDTWVCLEWEHRGSENVTRFFVDGVEHPSLATTAQDHGGTASEDYILPQMTSFWFGFWQYQADPEPFDVWIDELALDESRIGCEK